VNVCIENNTNQHRSKLNKRR